MGLTYVFLPGLHGTGELFKPILKEMPPDIGRLVVEYPRDRAMGYSALLKRIERAVADLSDLVVVGESFSGVLALRLGLAMPQRVRAVVMVAGFVTPSVPRLLCWLGAPLALFRVPIPGIGIRCFLSGFRASQEVVRATRREVGRVSGHVVAHRMLAVAGLNATDELRASTVPTLYVAGRRDRLVGRRAVRKISRVRPDVEVRTLDAPHLLLQTCGSEAWEVIRAFGARHAAVV